MPQFPFLCTHEGKRDLHILVTGTVGAGKSALINSIIGKDSAHENYSPKKETTKVFKYEKRAGNSTISIYESPGLQLEDDNETENQYLNYVEEDCSEVDLNLYCVKMSDRIRPSAVDAVKRLCCAFGKKEFRQKTLFVLTFANEIKLPELKKSSMLVEHFGDQMIVWKKLLQTVFTDKVGISKEAAANVPIVPAGYHNNLSLPAADRECDDWLQNLWVDGLKIDDLNAEQDKGWEAAMIAYLQSKGRDNLCICVIGRTGTGKSALVNSMVGKTDARAEEGDTASRVTAVVARYRRRIGNCTIFIYDSPGLHDDKEIVDQYWKDLEENCGEVDLNLYCVRMNNKMQPSEIDAIKKFSFVFRKNDFWRKTLFVLTFANEIVLPKQKISSKLLKHFRDQLTEWEKHLQKALTDKAGISEEAAANVPVVPAGYRDELSLRAAKCNDWLSRLRTKCFDQIKDIARPISSSINWGQLHPSEEVKTEAITNTRRKY
jgi:GTPase Era involved in 16S rRNA processing